MLTQKGDAGPSQVAALAAVLYESVAGGASVGFLAPLTQTAAEDCFRHIIDEIAGGRRILFAAFADLKLLGTVLVLVIATRQCFGNG